MVAGSWTISAQSTVQGGRRLEAMLKKQNGRVGVEERSRAKHV
jgi:hypothetical protein